VADTVKTQGLILIAERRESTLQQACAGELTLVLDSVQDPGNVGALLRTAEAAGVGGIVLLEGCADPASPKALRSAMGSAFRLPVARGITAEDLLDHLAEHRIRAVVTAGVDAVRHTDFHWRQRIALILGNEGNGVRNTLLEACADRVCIQMKGSVESLNVAAAGAVLLFEAARQHG
jgi:TrmH family RNA methyltransferase